MGRAKNFHLGGLVGKQGDARILASFANARIITNNNTNTGGLVGLQNNSNARIVASYSNGLMQVTGGGGNLGGLVGRQSDGIILASYANNSIQSVTGNIGKLVGRVSGMIVESYGLSSITGTLSNNEGATLFANIGELSAENVGVTWNQANSDTLGAWDFSTVPLLNYADYDGVGNEFACQNASDASTLSTTIIIPNCAALLLGQTGVGYDFSGDEVTISWTNNANFYRILRSENQGIAREIISGETASFGSGMFLSWSDTTLTEGATYSYTIQFCENEQSCRNVETSSFVNNIVDRDGDGLIEIDSLEELHNIRYNLLGTGYRISTNSIPIARGCPNGVCNGYELTTNLDFDRDGDGSTWSVSGDVYTLDNRDVASYFDTTNGWTPIGNADNSFQAVLEGNGYSINNLAVVTSDNRLGLFGVLGALADIRGVNISNALIRQSGSVETFMGVLAGESRGTISSSDVISSRVIAGDANEDNVGGLVGRQEGGNIVASSAKELVVSGARGNYDRVGGLVGGQLRGDIVASSAKAEAKSGGNAWNYVGGLVGEQGNNARIIASYAEGTVDNEGILNGQTGGLVGTVGAIDNSDVKIIASYANAVVKGGNGASARSGGLVGSFERGSITASYSAGRINASEGDIGKLIGINHSATAGMIVESYGFSSITGTANNSEGEPPTGVTIAQGLTAINTGATWNQVSSDTLGAWNFFITPFLRLC